MRDVQSSTFTLLNAAKGSQASTSWRLVNMWKTSKLDLTGFNVRKSGSK